MIQKRGSGLLRRSVEQLNGMIDASATSASCIVIPGLDRMECLFGLLRTWRHDQDTGLATCEPPELPFKRAFLAGKLSLSSARDRKRDHYEAHGGHVCWGTEDGLMKYRAASQTVPRCHAMLLMGPSARTTRHHVTCRLALWTASWRSLRQLSG